MLSYSNYNSDTFHKFNNNHKSQQPAQEQQQIPIPESLNNENDSDNPKDIVFSIRRNATLQILYALTRDPEIHENNRSSFNRDQ